MSKPDDPTKPYPEGALDFVSALDEAKVLTFLAIGHPDRATSLWYTNEALDLLQRLHPNH